MPCKTEDLRQIPLFALLDDDEIAVLAAQVEVKKFAARQRIYKIGEPGKHAYVMMSGQVRVTTVDHDHQEVLVEERMCLEVSRDDMAALLQQKPMAGMDMLTVVSRQFHASQALVRIRASRNSNDVIEEEMGFGDRIADAVARFGGSWTFIILFGVVLLVYTSTNTALKSKAWDPYPFILLNLFLSIFV